MPHTSISSRQYSHEPEILYEYIWACNLHRSAAKIAGVLNLSTTDELLALRLNAETQRIIMMYSESFESDRPTRFRSLWLQAQGDHVCAMTDPAPPQIDVQNGTGKIPKRVFEHWCITRLMRLAPALFPRCNLDTTPPKFDAYDYFYALCVLLWLKFGRQSYNLSNYHPQFADRTVRWHREPSADRLGTQSPVSPIGIGIEEPATPLAPTNTLEPEHALPAPSVGDNIGLPDQGAIGDYAGAREMLYQFASKLCEQFQQVQISASSDPAEKGENANTQFADIDGLVEKYTQTIERSRIRVIAANNKFVGQVANHCAQMGNQGEEIGSDRDTGLGVKHSGKRFQTAPKTQIRRRNNGVSKSRTRPSKVLNAGSNERIQAAFNSELAGASNSPDQVDSVNSSTAIELDSVIEIDLTKD
ncbi:unnamed protein product [Penicillium nalgiovense]|uniref:Uncharacterized protein n=1 Tax=Penicillium nalgiovense TaxID=60175 RepID=A0A1V6YQT7_PENNA|nr:hypothetical protein PENNAL_c0013G00247 [Penicillium nalgiovense]CAG7953322.1 unnamed protein product [Penicillium nalgiovense]CAG7960753.1 unnamed protein product [Penicillium nalgiovense]CAG7965873.1 unnamed protein product [Penicillium nalgiovense]CAG7970541.1 unnamed protein product [Penicillium nalgiovense]